MAPDDDPATPEIDGWQNVARAIMLRIQTYRCGQCETLIPREEYELAAWRAAHMTVLAGIEEMMEVDSGTDNAG